MRYRIPAMSDRTALIVFSPFVPLILVAVAMHLLTDRIAQMLAPSGEWHAWFAWRPVCHHDDVTWLWLETVERRHSHDFKCMYRERTTP